MEVWEGEGREKSTRHAEGFFRQVFCWFYDVFDEERSLCDFFYLFKTNSDLSTCCHSIQLFQWHLSSALSSDLKYPWKNEGWDFFLGSLCLITQAASTRRFTSVFVISRLGKQFRLTHGKTELESCTATRECNIASAAGIQHPILQYINAK